MRGLQGWPANFYGAGPSGTTGLHRLGPDAGKWCGRRGEGSMSESGPHPQRCRRQGSPALWNERGMVGDSHEVAWVTPRSYLVPQPQPTGCGTRRKGAVSLADSIGTAPCSFSYLYSV